MRKLTLVGFISLIALCIFSVCVYASTHNFIDYYALYLDDVLIDDWDNGGWGVDINDGDDTVYDNVTYTSYEYHTMANGNICHTATHYYTWRYADGVLVSDTYHVDEHDCN